MNPRTTLTFLLLLVTGAVLRAWTPGEAVPPQGPLLTLFVTGDQNGELTSCGCAHEDYGGLTRRAAFLDTLRAGGWDFLLLDGGDLTPYFLPSPFDRLKTETMARAMATLGYQGVVLGEHDLAAGPDSALALAGWLGQPVLATNYDLPGVSERERVVTTRGWKVGLLSFLDPGLASAAAPWLAVEPWERSKARVRNLRKRVDVLVALAHVPDTTAATRLARLYPEINLVVASHEGKLAANVWMVGKTAVVGAAGRGRYLTQIGIPMDEKGHPGEAHYAYLPVVEGWGRRAAIDTLVAGYFSRVQKLLGSEGFADEQRKNLREPPAEYVGSEACASCHPAQTDQWRHTLHSRARESLARDAKEGDPECQPCHTTGFGFRTGFLSSDTTPGMWGVGCESCHGGGAAHVTTPKLPYGTVARDLCVTCHDTDQDPDFSYELALPQVSH